jgi:hypothetical protein
LSAALSEYAKNAPPIDFKARFDSLGIMEGVMRHFYLRALIEERMGAQADWNAVDSLMQKALAAAEKVARYRHAQLSAVRLAGDINAKNYDDVAQLDDTSIAETRIPVPGSLKPQPPMASTSSPTPESAGERRHVTVMFSDLVSPAI